MAAGLAARPEFHIVLDQTFRPAARPAPARGGRAGGAERIPPAKRGADGTGGTNCPLASTTTKPVMEKTPMRSLILATGLVAAAALSIPVLAPVTAHAQQSRPGTDAQTDLRQSVRAKQARHPTAKRHEIIRSERSTPDSTFTEGSGGRMR